MAPEIKEGKIYDGKKADIFSLGVILFIMVQGIFPFAEAKSNDYYYKLILEGQYEKYWEKVAGKRFSDEFKDLLLRMISYDPSQRPTIEEIQNHPWMQKEFEQVKAKEEIISKINENMYEKSTNSTTSSTPRSATPPKII